MDLTNIIGLGIAGNFAGHLEQAGEAKDFEKVAVDEAQQPKALFPFYVPSEESGFLSVFPLSNDTILIPESGGNIQIEPEVAIFCDVHYEGTQVVGLEPRRFGAYNDCSIRRPNAKRISEKKNWGAQSKGIAPQLIEIDKVAQGGIMDPYRIACYLKRDGEYHDYGVDSPVEGYSYFNQKLIDWIVDRMNHQPDQDPMESIATHLKQAGYPTRAIVSVGATRYTAFGERHFLQAGDQSIVLVYDGTKYSPESIKTMLIEGSLPSEHVSALIQDIKHA